MDFRLAHEAARAYSQWRAALSNGISRLLSCVVICLLLGACVPISTDVDAPKISGVLLDGGRAVADADVVLFSETNPKLLRTRTDAAGRFSIGPLQEVEFFVLPMGDRFVSYGLRFQQGGHTYSSGGSMIPVWAHAGGLVCDISATGGGRTDRLTIFLDKRISPLERESSKPGLRCWDPRVGLKK